MKLKTNQDDLQGPIPARRDLADHSCWLAYLALVLAAMVLPIMAIGGRVKDTDIWRYKVAIGCFLLGPVLAVMALGFGYLARFKRHSAAARRDGVFVGWAVLLATALNFLTIPQFVQAKVTRSRGACENYLHQIQLAKEQWAKDNHKQPTDMPAMDDLVGPNKYIKQMPTCPAGGFFTPGNLTNQPKCSINDFGHRLE